MSSPLHAWSRTVANRLDLIESVLARLAAERPCENPKCPSKGMEGDPIPDHAEGWAFKPYTTEPTALCSYCLPDSNSSTVIK